MYANSHSTSSNNHKNSDSTSSYSDQSTTNGTSSNTRQRTTTNSTHSTSSSDYTPEEAEAVRKYVKTNNIYLVNIFFSKNYRVKTCKDLYEILGVNKSATEADLKKAYRKLALQVRTK
jgi:DnaJ family protein B protein 12